MLVAFGQLGLKRHYDATYPVSTGPKSCLTYLALAAGPAALQGEHETGGGLQHKHAGGARHVGAAPRKHSLL